MISKYLVDGANASYHLRLMIPKHSIEYYKVKTPKEIKNLKLLPCSCVPKKDYIN